MGPFYKAVREESMCGQLLARRRLREVVTSKIPETLEDDSIAECVAAKLGAAEGPFEALESATVKSEELLSVGGHVSRDPLKASCKVKLSREA